MEVRIKRGNFALRQAHTRLCERAGFVQTYASTVIRKLRREGKRWWWEEDTRLDVEARARMENLRKMCIESTGWGISAQMPEVWRPTEGMGRRGWSRSEKFSSLREGLILDHLVKLKNVIARWKNKVPKGYQDEMESVCTMGLVDASRRYLPIFRTSFWTYASKRIDGYVVDFLRSQDFVIRSDRKKHKEAIKNGTDFEIHEQIHIGTDKDGMDLYQNLGEIDKGYDKVSDREILKKVMRGFSRQERQVVQLYAVDGYTMWVVGEIMNLSESRVYQIWQQILEKTDG